MSEERRESTQSGRTLMDPEALELRPLSPSRRWYRRWGQNRISDEETGEDAGTKTKIGEVVSAVCCLNLILAAVAAPAYARAPRSSGAHHAIRITRPKSILSAVLITIGIIIIVLGIECSPPRFKCARARIGAPQPTSTPRSPPPGPSSPFPVTVPNSHSPQPTTTSHPVTPTCLPPFAGMGLSISNTKSGLEWSIPTPVQADGLLTAQTLNETNPPRFQIEFIAGPTNAYRIRTIENSTLVVSAINAPNLTLALSNLPDSRHYWDLTCERCASASVARRRTASGCVITALVGRSCVQPQAIGEPLRLATCDGLPHQKFDFTFLVF